jgi:archaellum component FlaG (FlaF/FlaG flagellin family)
MSIIKDGSGTGNSLRINEENRADVESVNRSIDQHINELYEKVFSLPFDAIDPTGADDYFLYIKNTGTKNLHVEALELRSTVAGTVEIHQVSGTASSGTTLTPVNRTLGSSASITATIETGADITGLSSEGILEYIRCAAVNTSYRSEITSHIIMPPGQAMALLWDTSTGALSGMITVYEDQGVT